MAVHSIRTVKGISSTNRPFFTRYTDKIAQVIHRRRIEQMLTVSAPPVTKPRCCE